MEMLNFIAQKERVRIILGSNLVSSWGLRDNEEEETKQVSFGFLVVGYDLQGSWKSANFT